MILALALAALLFGVPGAAPETSVAKVLDDWHAAAAAADEARYFSHFSPDGVFLGTDGAERWTAPEFRRFAHPYFAKGKAWSFHAHARHVAFSPEGTVAWFDEALDAQPRTGARLGRARPVRRGVEDRAVQPLDPDTERPDTGFQGADRGVSPPISNPRPFALAFSVPELKAAATA